LATLAAAFLREEVKSFAIGNLLYYGLRNYYLYFIIGGGDAASSAVKSFVERENFMMFTIIGGEDAAMSEIKSFVEKIL